MTLLETIQSPADLKPLTADQLQALAKEIRGAITETVAARGGHLASNLGVVELTLALHRAFDFRTDHLVFDVGHQCYAHKLITGRREAFRGLRTAGGASGFPNPAEAPEYDLFRTGHAGASISTALGLALAAQAEGSEARAVAVVGDGALSCGLALEALNHAGDVGVDLLVVLNDNQMAISPTVGSVARWMTAVRTTRAYGNLKADVREMLDSMPMGQTLTAAISSFKQGLKEIIVPDHPLEHLFGFRCYGPVDGHDVAGLEEVLGEMRRLRGPRLLHVYTEKGRGFKPASDQPARWHSARPFTEKNGEVVPPEPPPVPPWTDVAMDTLTALGEGDARIVGITAAMPEGSGLERFGERFPDRFHDVGICEAHAVALAAGLARGGRRPVVGIYSTFLQRSYDQLFHEVALQGLPIVFLVDRAGLVGADGPTHHGLYDIAYLRHLPGFTLAAPADRHELGAMLRLALEADGPWAIRYPRDRVPEADVSDAPVEAGRAAVLREGDAGAILALGATVAEALDTADRLAEDDLHVTVASARFAKPVDADLVADLLDRTGWVLTAEDHTLPGGFGSAVLEAAATRGLDVARLHRLGVGETFVEHAARRAQLGAAGLTADGIVRTVRDLAGR